MPPLELPSEELPDSDRKLVREVRAGSEYAATLLYERYAQRLLGFVASKMGARVRAANEPEDVVQSIFRSVFRKIQSGHYDAPPGATLWSLMAVIAVRKIQYRARSLSTQSRDAKRTVPLDALTIDEQLSSVTPEFLHLSVEEIIATLQPIDQEILSLRLQMYSVEEISERTQRTRRTVERSLKRLREHLSDLLMND